MGFVYEIRTKFVHEIRTKVVHEFLYKFVHKFSYTSFRIRDSDKVRAQVFVHEIRTKFVHEFSYTRFGQNSCTSCRARVLVHEIRTLQKLGLGFTFWVCGFENYEDLVNKFSCALVHENSENSRTGGWCNEYALRKA